MDSQDAIFDPAFLKDFQKDLIDLAAGLQTGSQREEKAIRGAISRAGDAAAARRAEVCDHAAKTLGSGMERARRGYTSHLELVESPPRGERCRGLYEQILKGRQSGPDGREKVEALRASLLTLKPAELEGRDAAWRKFEGDRGALLRSWDADLEATRKRLLAEDEDRSSELRKELADIRNRRREHAKRLMDEFLGKFQPEAILSEYAAIVADIPNPAAFACRKELPDRVSVLSLAADMAEVDGYASRIAPFLDKHYPFLHRNGQLTVPLNLSFDSSFNFYFNMAGPADRDCMVKTVNALILNLFMALPPGKAIFSFIDPVTLGTTFGWFNNLVDPDDRTNKVINGGIMHTAPAIRDCLRVLTERIAYVTQHCLKGNHRSIREYNDLAKSKAMEAEAYHILMMMDYPAGMDEESFRMLEQIINTGAENGVFAVVMENPEQTGKADNRTRTLRDNIRQSLRMRRFTVQGEAITSPDPDAELHGGQLMKFNFRQAPRDDHKEKIKDALKNGVKNAEKKVITFQDAILSQIDGAGWHRGTCAEELSIPIGTRGAGELQNLSFGMGGKHHALIVGQIGSGKSTLLHTIIMSSLVRYNADELQIFLLDFKRGVEFKIYANHSLRMFRAVAVESEREFGNSILKHLDDEMTHRSDMSKLIPVTNLPAYREQTGKVMPRILLIIDEFHVLFSKDNDPISRDASQHLENIIRLGRAFGLHVILASQSMAGVGGIEPAVWGQVAVRIALKCPKADAQAVLGPDNDGVDLLSPDDPGQAVFNSEGGAPTANSIFRVSFLETKEQDQLLAQVSREAASVELKQDPPPPETRVMLTNIEDNIYNRFDRCFARENIDLPAENDFSPDAISIGEPLQLSGRMRMAFRDRRPDSNLLIAGNDEARARAAAAFACLSLALGHLGQNKGAAPSRPIIHIVDYAAPEETRDRVADPLLRLAWRLGKYIRYGLPELPEDRPDLPREDPFHEKSVSDRSETGGGMRLETADSLFMALRRELRARLAWDKDVPREHAYWLFFGLQRATRLKSPMDEAEAPTDGADEERDAMSIIDSVKTVTRHEVLLEGWREGGRQNLHSIAWMDHFKTFMAQYPDQLDSFDLRVGFAMPDEDSLLFLSEPHGSRIGENGAIFNGGGKKQKFRPYRKPRLEWLEELCQRIAGGGE